MSKILPILFSPPMVQSILEGRKTMTRREVKRKKAEVAGLLYLLDAPEEFMGDKDTYKRELIRVGAKYEVGDVLWVRETWANLMGLVGEELTPQPIGYKYKADSPGYIGSKWKPFIFMPKEACRIFLEVTGVKVERLQDITEEDAAREGVERDELWINGLFTSAVYKDYTCPQLTDRAEWFSKAYYSFQTLWKSINGKESWDQNPFVFCYTFKRVDKPTGFGQI